MKNQISSAEGE